MTTLTPLNGGRPRYGPDSYLAVQIEQTQAEVQQLARELATSQWIILLQWVALALFLTGVLR